MKKSRLKKIEARLASIETQLDRIAQLAQETRELAGPFGVALPDGTILVQTLWGHKLYVDALDLIMTPHLVIYRQWEHDVSAVLVDYATPDTVFVDVGANSGYFTFLVASRIGPNGSGRVIAIEPNPHCLELLRRNAVINWSLCPVQIEPVAVSNKNGCAPLIVPKDRAANAHIGSATSNGDAIEVPMKRLDDVVEQNLTVDLLKIDVEGFEFFALDGAHDVIHRSPSIKIIMEWSPEQLKTSPEDLLKIFGELDLIPCRLPCSFKDMCVSDLAYSAEELRMAPYTNILLVRRLSCINSGVSR
jgi:FkbM family methyltransferase